MSRKELLKELEKAKRDIRRGSYNTEKILLLLIECQIGSYKVKMKRRKKNSKNNKGDIYT